MSRHGITVAYGLHGLRAAFGPKVRTSSRVTSIDQTTSAVPARRRATCAMPAIATPLTSNAPR